MVSDKIVKIYVDQHNAMVDINVDDFIVAIGIKQSNSVYHIFESLKKKSPKHERLTRFHLKCYKSDLITALNKDKDQKIIPMVWYKRNNKNEKR